jgi:hypothetical protein
MRDGSGNDTLTGGGGPSVVGRRRQRPDHRQRRQRRRYGQTGTDTPDGLDSPTYTDRLSCGTENDTTTSDAPDLCDPDCETNVGF